MPTTSPTKKSRSSRAGSNSSFDSQLDKMFKVNSETADSIVPAIPVIPDSPYPIQWIDVDKIDMGDLQPRLFVDPDELEDLKASIHGVGLLHAVLLRPHPTRNGRFLIIAGHRRTDAIKGGANAARPDTPNREHWRGKIPSLVISKNLTPLEILTIAMEENTNRVDINAIEKGLGYKKLYDMFCAAMGRKVTWAEIGQQTGLSYRQMKRYMDLAKFMEKLPDEFETRLKAKFTAKDKDERWTERHGRVIMGMSDAPRLQAILIRQMLKEDLSAQKAEARAKAIRESEPTEGDLRLRDAAGNELGQQAAQSATQTAETNRARVAQGNSHLTLVPLTPVATTETSAEAETTTETTETTSTETNGETYVQGVYTAEMVADLHLDESAVGQPIPRLYDPHAPQTVEVAPAPKNEKLRPSRVDVANEMVAMEKRLQELRLIGAQADDDEFGNGEIRAVAAKLGFIATAINREF